MTLTQIEYVMKTVQCGSMTRAAESLFISQPALSTQIRALEKELGCMLFHRSATGISLTGAGEKFCAYAKPLLQEWEVFQEQTEGLNETICQTIRIGLGVRAVSNELFGPVVDFFDRHPETNVTFLTDLDRDVFASLEERQLDLALCRLPPEGMLKHEERFYIQPLLTERQCVLVSPKDPRAAKSSVSIRELDGVPMGMGPVGSIDDREGERLFRHYGIAPSRVMRSDAITTVMAMVRSGKCAALGPASFADHFGVDAVPMEPEMRISLNLVCRREDRDHVLIRQLGRYLKNIREKATGETAAED